MRHKKYLQIAAILGALTVVLGAFGAHGLKKIVAIDLLPTFETAVRYQFYHVLALAITAIAAESTYTCSKMLNRACLFFVIGILLFSGSLYALVTIKTLQINALWIGAITPIGGVTFIVGWLCLALGIKTKKS